MRKNITEKIADVELEIEQLINLKKELLAKHKEEERRARTKRLCERAGYLESILPDTVTLTKEQFQTFLDKTLLTGFADKILKGIIPPASDPAAEKSTGTAA
jgi:hypothetical protein